MSISEMKFYSNYLASYSHTNIVFCAMFTTHSKWSKNSRAGLIGITSYKTDRIRPKLNFTKKQFKLFFSKVFRDLHLKFCFICQFCTRLCLNVFWREILREAILNFLTKMLSGETLCKLDQIFPPKDLVQFFLHTF